MTWTQPVLARLAAAAACLALAACGGGGGGGEPPPTGGNPPPPTVTKAQLDAAARATAQASFGVPYDALEPIARQGFPAWLNDQIALPATFHSPTTDAIIGRLEAGEFAGLDDVIDYVLAARRLAWWHTTVTAEDTLRQRVAFALSQIFVVSDNVDILAVNPEALSTYYDVLLANAFGNYRDLLRDVALSPAMGVYLSHLNNRRADPARNIFPDENFAREVMQLFSIGLFELNTDGTLRVDANSRPIATYDNGDIREFAKIFTGLSYGGPGAFFGNDTQTRFDLPMEMFDEAHEPGEKRLLNGVVVPAGQTGIQDFEAAIDNLFQHPNVGPFIGKQLIQRLVSSNPSPAYVARVAETFNDNGNGVRGDMAAVIRAILLDAEATESPALSTAQGKLREPVVRYASILRQFGANSSDGFIGATGYTLQLLTRQHPLSAPSVFNFYLPDHSPAGELADAGLVAPEFQITNASTIIGFPNLVDFMLFGNIVTDPLQGFSEVSLDITPWTAVADDPALLVERLDTLLTFGALDAQVRDQWTTALADIQDSDFRARLAIYLFLTSPDYAVRQ